MLYSTAADDFVKSIGNTSSFESPFKEVFANPNLKTRPSLIIGDSAIDVPDSGYLDIDEKYRASRGPAGGVRITSNLDPNYYEMLLLNGQTAELQTSVGSLTVSHRPPDYFMLSGRPMLNLDCVNSKTMAQMRISAQQDKTALLEWGAKNGISAHGVELDKGGIQSLVGIAATGRIIGPEGGAGYWGPLINFYPDSAAGGHGPFYVFGNEATDQ